MGRRLPGRRREAAGGRTPSSAGCPALAREPDAARRQRPLDRLLRPGSARPLGVHDRGLDRPLGHLAGRARAQGRGGAERPRGRALGGRRHARRRAAHGRRGARPRARARPPREGPVSLGQDARGRRRPASGRPSAPGTSSSPARSAASQASSRRCRGSPSSASTSSTCRRSTRSAARTARARNNALTARPGDPGSPWAIGAEEGGHDRDPPRPRHARRLRAARRRRRRGSGSRSRSTSRSSARPTTPGCASTRSGSTAVPTGRSSTPRTRRSATRTSTTSTSRARTGAGSGRRCSTSSSTGSSHGVTRLPRRQPAHEAARVLGVADRRGAAPDDPDVVFLAEAFTRPGDDARRSRRSGFSQSYTYFTWRNTRWELIEYITELALDDADYFRPNFFANTPDILHEYLQARRPARRSRRGSCSPRRCRRATASTPASSTARTRRCTPGSEEYLDSEKYEVEAADARRAAAAAGRAPERASGARTAPSSGSTTSPSSRRRTSS